MTMLLFARTTVVLVSLVWSGCSLGPDRDLVRNRTESLFRTGFPGDGVFGQVPPVSVPVTDELYARPDLMHRILEINAQAVIDYLNAQIEAGAQAVQVFDTWGGALADGIYQQFSLAYMARVVNGIRAGADGQRVPVILFTKGGGLWLEAMAATGADALGVDWTVNLQLARQRTAGRVALQGNLDPTVLFAEPDAIRAQVRRVLEDYAARGGSDGHIFNLGHGISQFTPPEAVSVLVDEVHSFSRALRTKAKSHG